MTQKKYIICPGWVYSADGDRHFIDYSTLVRLYGVRKEECVHERGIPRGLSVRGMRYLRPSNTGNYDL